MNYRKMDMSYVTKNYFHLMTTALVMPVASSLVAYIMVRNLKCATTHF